MPIRYQITAPRALSFGPYDEPALGPGQVRVLSLIHI